MPLFGNLRCTALFSFLASSKCAAVSKLLIPVAPIRNMRFVVPWQSDL